MLLPLMFPLRKLTSCYFCDVFTEAVTLEILLLQKYWFYKLLEHVLCLLAYEWTSYMNL